MNNKIWLVTFKNQKSIVGHDAGFELDDFGCNKVSCKCVTMANINDVIIGDIILSPEIASRFIPMKTQHPTILVKSLVDPDVQLWTDNKDRNGQYIVSYQINYGLDDLVKKLIPQALAQIENESCIKFVEHSQHRHKDFIEFIFGYQCASHIGRIGGKQPIYLDPSCGKNGVHTITHEVN